MYSPKTTISQIQRKSFLFEEANFLQFETNASVKCFMQSKFKQIMDLDNITDFMITSSLDFKKNKKQLF